MQISKPDSPLASKMTLGTSAGHSGSDKDLGNHAASGALKQLGEPPSEDKSSFKPYSKGGGGGNGNPHKEGASGNGALSQALEKTGFQVSSAACPPFPLHGAAAPTSLSSSASLLSGSRGSSPQHVDCKGSGNEKKELEGGAKASLDSAGCSWVGSGAGSAELEAHGEASLRQTLCWADGMQCPLWHACHRFANTALEQYA